ncbi:MAG: MBL fold metallo-hydrolase [Eggerthellaceae bacterium]|nr:MBL fold metallo-hydrolase [Eggerthellaceae bacterium]
MKKVFAFALAAVLAFAAFALAGCGQGEGQGSDGGTMDGVRVSFIDVGKGDCILVQAGGSAALIDTGYDSTSDEVLSYLSDLGVSRLDWVVLTHYDQDHVGGLRAIGEKLDIGTVFLPGYVGKDKNYKTAMSAIEGLGLATQLVTERLHLKLGDYDFDLFPPGVEYDPGSKGEEGNDNDCSLVASLTGDGASFLFAGDLEEDGIAAYLEDDHGRFDVVKMPHHGRKASLTDEFLEDVRPQIAIITDSKDDPADKKTLKMLDAIDAEAYRTGTYGTITVQCDGTGGYSVSN